MGGAVAARHVYGSSELARTEASNTPQWEKENIMIGRMKTWKGKLFLTGLAALVMAGCGGTAKLSTAGLGGGSITRKTLAKAIENHVAKAGATFSFSDPAINKKLNLRLLRVHKDRLSRLGPDLYFACSDFKETGGKVYDLDFWVNVSGGQLSVTKTMLHKEDGKPRYTWYEDGGVWQQKFAGAAKTGAEHPQKEHPAKKKAEHPTKKKAEHPKRRR